MKVRTKATLLSVAATLSVLLMGCDKTMLATGDRLERTAGVSNAVAPQANADMTHDALLAAHVTDVLRNDPATGDTTIYVSVTGGHARLSGFVDTTAAKLRAGVLVAGTDGVDDVENRLIVRHHADLSQDPIADARVRL